MIEGQDTCQEWTCRKRLWYMPLITRELCVYLVPWFVVPVLRGLLKSTHGQSSSSLLNNASSCSLLKLTASYYVRVGVATGCFSEGMRLLPGLHADGLFSHLNAYILPLRHIDVLVLANQLCQSMQAPFSSVRLRPFLL